MYYKVLGFWNDGTMVKHIFEDYMMAHREYLLLKENNIYCNDGLKELSMDDSNGKTEIILEFKNKLKKGEK